MFCSGDAGFGATLCEVASVNLSRQPSVQKWNGRGTDENTTTFRVRSLWYRFYRQLQCCLSFWLLRRSLRFVALLVLFGINLGKFSVVFVQNQSITVKTIRQASQQQATECDARFCAVTMHCFCNGVLVQ